MCEFISWIEKDEKVYFLTANQIFRTAKGKALREYCGSSDDYTGHGAIRHYYQLEGGLNKECNDFSTPDNFPLEISEAVKLGKMAGLGIASGLLGQPAWAEYRKIKQAAWAEYRKIEQPARAEYEKIKQAASAEYRKIEQAAFWNLFAIPENRNPKWR